MISAITTLPVLGVPVKSRTLNGVDSLLSIVQMPAGVPTASFAVGEAGATMLPCLPYLCLPQMAIIHSLKN